MVSAQLDTPTVALHSNHFAVQRRGASFADLFKLLIDHLVASIWRLLCGFGCKHESVIGLDLSVS
jgi:ABC-type nitrate/sulfonate/bicarbonate transport system permease component